VQRVADLVGYQNAGDFTRAFRRRFGVTPGQFRQVAKGASGDASQDAGDEPVSATGLRA
jgi:AraC-like DNA-binding protein